MNSGRFVHGMFAKLRRSLRSSVCGIEPIVGADQFKVQLRSVARIMPRSEAGKRAVHFFGMNSIVAMTMSPRISDFKAGSESALKISKQFLRGGIRGGSLDAEEVVELTDEDDEGDAAGGRLFIQRRDDDGYFFP